MQTRSPTSVGSSAVPFAKHLKRSIPCRTHDMYNHPPHAQSPLFLGQEIPFPLRVQVPFALSRLATTIFPTATSSGADRWATYVCLVGDVAKHEGHHHHVHERDPNCSRRPAEVEVAVGVHFCSDGVRAAQTASPHRRGREEFATEGEGGVVRAHFSNAGSSVGRSAIRSLDVGDGIGAPGTDSCGGRPSWATRPVAVSGRRCSAGRIGAAVAMGLD